MMENKGLAPRQPAVGVGFLGAAAATMAILLGTAIVLEGPVVAGKLFRRAKVGRIDPQPGSTGQKVQLTAGSIPVMDFLKCLSDSTGLPVLHDSTDQNITTREITLAADIPEADEDLVKAILEVNRVRVWREVIPNGKELLKVESMVPDPANPGLTIGGVRNISER